jgi:hypothetical protein
MMDVRRRPRFPQKTRPGTGILRDFAIDNLEGNKRVQNCISRTVSYGHRSGTELDRKTVCPCLYFEVGVSQWSGCQPTACRWSFGLLAIREEGKTNETTQAFAVRTTLRQRSAARRAGLRSFTLRFLGSAASADIVHVGTAVSGE